MPKEEHQRRVSTTAILLVILIIFLSIFVIRPSLIGYGIYKDVENSELGFETYGQDVQELRLQTATLSSNLSLQSEFNQQIRSELATAKEELIKYQGENAALSSELDSAKQNAQLTTQNLQDQLDQCKENLESTKTESKEKLDTSLKTQSDQLTKEKEQCSQDLQETTSALSSLQVDYDLLIKNSAKSICCKVRVDNPDISAYAVLEHKIVCLEEGEKKLEC